MWTALRQDGRSSEDRCGEMQQGGGRVGYTPECADAHRLWHCGCFVLFIRTPKRVHKILRITVTGMPPQRLRCSSLTRSSTLNLPSCRVPDANRISCLWLARRYTAAYRVSRRGARRLPRVRALALGHFCATRTLHSHPPLAPSTRTLHSHPPLAPSPRRSRAAGPRRPRGPPVHPSRVPVAGAHGRGAIRDR